MAWHIGTRSLDEPDSMTGRRAKAKRWPLDSHNALDAVLRRDRAVAGVVLVTALTASWLYLLSGAGTGMYPHEMAMLYPTMSMESSMADMLMSPAIWTPGYALLMFSMWWLMMIAMMLPSAAPMVLLHAAVTRKGLARTDDAGPSSAAPGLFSATTSFIAGYLVMWGGFALIAVAAQWALEREGFLSAMMVSRSRLLGASLLLAAGLWQLTPLKSACLSRCRSPISFLSAHWRPGTGGAFRMGTRHGVLCLGCCWFLMALLFYGGVMNLIWIIGLASFVLIEKTMAVGVVFGRAAGLILVAWGVWLGLAAF